jgi:hypothetical protein
MENVLVFIFDVFDVIFEDVSTVLADECGASAFVIKLIVSTNLTFIFSLFFLGLAPQNAAKSKRAEIIKSLSQAGRKRLPEVAVIIWLFFVT